jgi:tight adherence protein C
MGQQLLSAGLAFISVLFVFAGLSLNRRPSREKERLTQYAQRVRTLEEIELQAPFSERVLRPVLGRLASVVKRFTPESNLEAIRRDLVLGGSPNNLQANDFLGLKGMLVLLMGGGCLALMVLGKSPIMNTLLYSAALGFSGFMMPNVWLSTKISARKDAITRALPDALDLLTISVEAGLGFDMALGKVVEKWNNALTMEFARVLTEMRVGKPRREALRDMVARTEVGDVTAFVAAIIQADQLGVSISRVLQIQSEQMRIRRRQRAEEKAHEAPVKMTFPMVFLIFPALLIVILGPAIPRILETLGGGL